ncbi:MAG: tRNA preQ1(34) S-adenosylmethionine ribosyltransferase-isomerase QueA [bacterium]|nr:tRNA preQ1(34) S-adenosylmethionine ribosyltransferase-isomerase QueA [bacterium]
MFHRGSDVGFALVDLTEFNYELPRELIAQEALPQGREFARLLVLDRRKKDFQERRFSAIAGFFRAGDALVLNDTRVRPARAVGVKPGGGEVEILFLGPAGERTGDREEWKALIHPVRRLKAGAVLDLGDKRRARLIGKEGAEWRLEVDGPSPLKDWLRKNGLAPLPPYIKRKGREHWEEDREDYQTVFAREEGSVAAPTAGLHFTPGLLDEIRARGARVFFITLHLTHREFTRSPGPPAEGPPPEDYEIGAETAVGIAACRRDGGRIFAVGTTTVRTLEANYQEHGRINPGRGRAAIYIQPGHVFRAVDVLVTNFHLPGTSMLALTSGFGGKDLVLSAYQHAIREKFRFLSLGDAMIII